VLIDEATRSFDVVLHSDLPCCGQKGHRKYDSSKHNSGVLSAVYFLLIKTLREKYQLTHHLAIL
jgi:hypothetical protein